MNSPTPPLALSSHQAIMKCPWQWRQPFLDAKRESRKRKVGDGYFYDPVDPNFVDHLLPGYALQFGGPDVLESDEKENIQREIERLMTQKNDRRGRVDAAALAVCAASDDDSGAVRRENEALVDSILLMSKSVEASSLTLGLLASPKSVTASPMLSDESSSGSDDDDNERSSLSGDELFDLAEDRPTTLQRSSPSLELLSDNLQEAFFAAEDDTLLDFHTASTTASVVVATSD
ncbi:unnamed protein product [Hyaloperonospora brassicae]|uniref:Uncharacterized protein n=1 Tax=Hyaloperonospora brassicae TaxID=162125 RepID=A0AAV0U9S2_HYABA|nr:unnamed protein product [Hyaloperonospora brassicae]